MNMVKIYTGGYIPDLAILDEPEHPMHGWLFYKHPDGQMVSLADSRTFPNGYSAGYAQRYVDMQEAGLEEILRKAEKWDVLESNRAFGSVCSPLYEQIREKAKKWDELKWHTSCPHEDADCAISPELENVKADLKTIIAGMMIERSCVTCKGVGLNPNFGGSCVVCEGKGTVSRTARAEDVREFIEQTLKLFPLKDGAVLRMEG